MSPNEFLRLVAHESAKAIWQDKPMADYVVPEMAEVLEALFAGTLETVSPDNAEDSAPALLPYLFHPGGVTGVVDPLREKTLPFVPAFGSAPEPAEMRSAQHIGRIMSSAVDFSWAGYPDPDDMDAAEEQQGDDPGDKDQFDEEIADVAEELAQDPELDLRDFLETLVTGELADSMEAALGQMDSETSWERTP
jgi:hypothetical protein